MAPRKKLSNLAEAYAAQTEIEQVIIELKAKEADRLTRCAQASGVVIADLTDDQLIAGFRSFASTPPIAKPVEAARTVAAGPADKALGKPKAGVAAHAG